MNPKLIFADLAELLRRHGFQAGELEMRDGKAGHVTWFGGPADEVQIKVTITPLADAEKIGLTLPCDVRLPTGTTFSKGVSLSSFLDAAQRQVDEKFHDPAPEEVRLKRVRWNSFLRRMSRAAERAAVEAQMIMDALQRADFSMVVRQTIAKLPHEAQLEMAQDLLIPLGMVAVRDEFAYPDHGDEPAPQIEALRSYATSLGYVLIPSARAAEIDPALREAAGG
ncbi:hypothetical protein MPL3356_60615 [Mesorhizobium plurifarium]|uniref:Uncharacterized protein n=1 Tax=Mesorhizobium plurifarium TaxID=69974 RepID=A0A090EAF3_MESPL|nr:hypothetical protein MPL3356_60615 [Mesorhizobium plurifarium]